MYYRVRALDLRFDSRSDEETFKAQRESDLLRWTRVGALVGVLVTISHGIAILGFTGFAEILKLHLDCLKSQIAFTQQVVWCLTCAFIAGVTTLRLNFHLGKKWDWEILVMALMVCAVLVVILGQTSNLTVLFGEDPDEVWGAEFSSSREAWALLGVHFMTTSTAFFLPIRCCLSWIVPAVGLVIYGCTTSQSWDQVARILVLVTMSYIAWCGSWHAEKHMRTEFRAVRQVARSSTILQEQYAAMKQKTIEIREKDELAKSLQTVSKALCDTMVQLDDDFIIQDAEDTHDIFFEESMTGRSFTDLLRGDDRTRFKACASRAQFSHLPELLPVTLHRRYTTSEVHLLLVAHGHVHSGFILGIRVERDHFPTNTGTSGEGLRDASPHPSLIDEDDCGPSASVPRRLSAPSVPAKVHEEEGCWDDLMARRHSGPPAAWLPNQPQPPDLPCNPQPLSPKTRLTQLYQQQQQQEQQSQPQQQQSAQQPLSPKGPPPCHRQQARSMSQPPGTAVSMFVTPQAQQTPQPLRLPQPGVSLAANEPLPKLPIGPGSQSQQQQQHQQPSSQSLTSIVPRETSPRQMKCIDENCESDFSASTSYHQMLSAAVPKPTPVKARAQTFRMILKRWYVPRQNKSCCHYHTVLDSIEDTLEYILQDKCEPLFSPFPEQCPRCFCMNHTTRCMVCGLNFSPELM